MHIVDPGVGSMISNETIMSYHLMNNMVAKPDIIPQVATIFESEKTPFTSWFAKKGLTSKGLFTGMENDSYKVVGNTKVMAPAKGIRKRKSVQLKNAVCENLTKPGYGGSLITMYLDNNWLSPYDACELSDNRTILTNVDPILPEKNSDGLWEYHFKMNREDKDEFVNPGLLVTGKEIGFGYTNFYEMSDTAYEKYTFDSWIWTYLTIQRMKHSISGTAEAMKVDKIWLQHNDSISWVTKQEFDMLERWAYAREMQNVMGKGTVIDNIGSGDYVSLKDMMGRDILSGSGIINSGNGALKFPFPGKPTKKLFQTIMQTMQIFTDDEGVMELVFFMGQNAYWDFMEFANKELGIYGAPKLVTGEGSKKELNMDFGSYQMGGVKITPVWCKWFTDPSRPQNKLNDGSWAEGHRMIITAVGNCDIGSRNIQLLQLGDRGFKSGRVDGINKGGDNMANSVDGSHRHILSQTGILTMNMFGVAEAFVPIRH